VEVDGRRLLVREDREGPEGPAHGSKPATAAVASSRGRGGSVRGRGGRGGAASSRPAGEARPRAPATENAVYVGNLPWSIGWQHLKDLFAPYGATYAGGCGVTRKKQATHQTITFSPATPLHHTDTHTHCRRQAG